jgi:hypothetical protein
VRERLGLRYILAAAVVVRRRVDENEPLLFSVGTVVDFPGVVLLTQAASSMKMMLPPWIGGDHAGTYRYNDSRVDCESRGQVDLHLKVCGVIAPVGYICQGRIADCRQGHGS